MSISLRLSIANKASVKDPGMHVGLIGGIGPAGTITYYRTLTRLHAEAGRKLALTIVNADLRDMIANLEADNADGQAAIFAGHVDQLRASGCEAVAVTAIGGHFCIKELEAISSLPIINAITALDDYFAENGFKRIGILGTRAVMESKLYGISAVEVIAPPAELLAQVHTYYTDMSVAGAATWEQRRYLQDVGRALHRDQGAEAVLLGGTDLSLAFDLNDSEYPVLDSAGIHAEAIARVSMGA